MPYSVGIVDRSGGGQALVLTNQMVEDYLSSLSEKGRTQDTQRLYARVLRRFYRGLPAGKQVTQATLPAWRDSLVAAGYANRTVNTLLSVVNNALDFWGHRELQLRELLQSEEVAAPDLTRAEYFRLLQAARRLQEEELYLIVKLFVLTGVRVRDLPLLEVEQVRQGYLRTTMNGTQIRRFIPRCLQRELLDYIRRAGIREGTLFRGRNGGKPIHRSTVSKQIRDLCAEARVPVEKGSIRCLRRLYQEMYEEVERNIRSLVEHAYDQWAEQEQREVGWGTEEESVS